MSRDARLRRLPRNDNVSQRPQNHKILNYKMKDQTHEILNILRRLL